MRIAATKIRKADQTKRYGILGRYPVYISEGDIFWLEVGC